MKRLGAFEVSSNKKPKLDDEDEWDDDLDDQALDKCFELASQAYDVQTRPSNTTILPSYNGFKNPRDFAASTQLNMTKVSSCTTTVTAQRKLEEEIAKLRLENKEKEGEISVLRGKLKEASVHVQDTQQKSTEVWRDKLITTEKEAKTYKSQLEFKALEIANLKQQLAETRRSNLNGSLNRTHLGFEDMPLAGFRNKEQQSTKTLKEPILQPKYLLTYSWQDILKGINKDNHPPGPALCRTTRKAAIPYLQNEQLIDSGLSHHCPLLAKKRITIENIASDILELTTTNSINLDSFEHIDSLNRILLIALILIKDFKDYLENYGSCVRTEDIRQADLEYLKSKGQIRKAQQDLGAQSSQILKVISSLILCSSYITDYICRNSCLEQLYNVQTYAQLAQGQCQNDYNLLRLILSVLQSVGKFRLANQTEDFLLAVISLLKNIAKLDDTKYLEKNSPVMELFCSIFKELVFARPSSDVLGSLTGLLAVLSRYAPFMRFLFRRNSKSELLKPGPKGVLYYSEGVCSFCVLVIMLQNHTLKNQDICYNMLSFMYNSFKASHWIHHENGNGIVCACISRLYRLQIESTFQQVTDFVHYFGNRNQSDDFLLQGPPKALKKLLDHGSLQKVLSQMTFNNLEMVEKHVMGRELEKVLKENHLYDNDKLITEELPRISSQRFNPDF